MNRRDEYKENCGHCLHHRNIDGEWICVNPDSECYGCYTEYNDECREFEERLSSRGFSVTIKKK